MPNVDREFETFLVNFIIAGITSSVAKTFTAPIDRIKLILQNQNSSVHILTGQREKYKGLLDCLVRIPKEQGFLSLWRGNGANLLRYIPAQALNFSFHDFFKQNFQTIIGHGSNVQSVLVTYLSGGCAGACSILTVYPLKFCQTRLSVDMGTVLTKDAKIREGVRREFDGVNDCFAKIIKKEGIPGVYRGFLLALIGASTYRAMYFGTFDALKQMYFYFGPQYEVGRKLPMVAELIFAQSVTTVAGLFTYPFDTVGRRLMLESGQPKELKFFGNSWQAFKVMYTKEGISSFYKGALTNCIRSMCGALVLVFYDEFSYYTEWKEHLSDIHKK